MISKNSSGDEKPLSHVSYSQISTFKTCPRKWYYEKVLKIPVVRKSAGAATGAKHHNEIENYIITGVDCRTGSASANRAILDQYLEKYAYCNKKLQVEGTIDEEPLISAKGIPFTGRFDIRIPGYVGLRPEADEVGARTKYIDHKFKKDIGMYGVTKDSLADDIQVIIYSTWEFQRYGGEVVEFAHHQYPTQKIFGEYPEANEVSVSLSRDDVLKKFGAIRDTVDYEMFEVAQMTSVEDTPLKETGCSAYGGCPYSSQCPKGEKKTMATPVKKEDERPEGYLCVGVDLILGGKRVEVLDLGDIVQECQKSIANEHGAFDIRLADALGFGKYKAVLANAVLKKIDLKKNYYIRPQGMNNDILDVLMSYFPNRVVGAL